MVQPDSAAMTATQFVLFVVSALFPIVNPLGGSAMFLALTTEYPAEVRRSLALKVAINSFFLLVGSYMLGEYVLSFFGVSLPVVQVGGGLILVSSGWTMLKRGDDEDKKQVRDVHSGDAAQKAFYPLTLPLTVGPGSISVAIALGAEGPQIREAQLFGLVAALIGFLVIAIIVLLCYGFAERLARMLGRSAMSVFTRLSSFLLLCIGVEILWNGIKALLATLPPR